MAFTRVASLQSLWPGEMVPCAAGGARVLLVRSADDVRAYEDRCPHLGVPLSQGTLECDVLTCSAHGWQYDSRTGEGINPRNVRLTQLAVSIEDGEVFVNPRCKTPGGAS